MRLSINLLHRRWSISALCLLTFAGPIALAEDSQQAAGDSTQNTPAQALNPDPSKVKPPVQPGQTAPDAAEIAATAGVDKRVFGVLPNYRTANLSAPFEAISTRQKFTIATKDSFDYPVLFTTAVFTGLSQLEGSDNQVYGQGMKGFAYRYGIEYVDQVIGNYFPEAIVPTLFHTDPRYFRKGEGSKTGRLFYALSRIAICKNDNGNWTFNVNEFVGNPLAAIAASSYHPHERTAGAMATQAASFIISDSIGQVLKEFWPDVKQKMFKKRDEGH